jgi:diguanylate cyclase (GGDEF)-like protein
MSGELRDDGALARAGKQSLPLFLLSFRHRDELAASAKKLGRRVVAARRAEAIERRFVASAAAIVVVDARGALREGLAACEALTETVASTGAALIVMLSRNDALAIDRFLEAGITHYLISPFGEQEFVHALRLADRFVARVAGGDQAASERASLRLSETEAWSWRPGSRKARLSPAFAERIGHGRQEARLSELLRAMDRAGRRAANDAVTRLLTSGKATGFAHAIDAGGERVAHHIHFDDDRGVVIGLVEPSRGSIEKFAGPGDPLTGLPLAESVHEWLADQGGAHPACTLMLLGITRFGLVNAAFGRLAGDTVLQGIARRIERLVDQSGLGRFMIARTAGSEFAIAIGSPLAPEAAEDLAQRLVETVSRPFVSADRLINLTCRVGVATADAAGFDDIGGLFRRASAALTTAKHQEGGTVQMLDADGEAETDRRKQLEVDLRRALDNDEIDVVFQPQVKTSTGEIMGVEALARWRHPLLGALGAVPLFAAAARSDFVGQLSAHVQRRALEAAAGWPAALAHLRLSVNVTATDIAGANFVGDFLARVDDAGFPRHRLTVEVTESGLIEDLARASDLLGELRGAGLRVAIDDFGTGYSSLAYLKALPLDYLKIDKALAADITGSNRDRIVIRGVIDMARSLGLAVVAEGVETKAQLALLAREGCNYFQGFLCAPPLDIEALVAIVADKQPQLFEPAA